MKYHLSLRELTEGIRNGTYAGYTLWTGAGAASAAFDGSPSWTGLVVDLEQRYGIAAPSDGAGSSVDFLSRLEAICGKMGFAPFRRELRRRLIDDVNWSGRRDVIRAQAAIGARASAMVTLNIQVLSALPFWLLKPTTPLRQHHVSEQRKVPRPKLEAGVSSGPIVFAHGALDLGGECTITKSDYDTHRQTESFGAAINMSFGADILILGMSLDDDYLREALQQHRRSVRRIFWVDKVNEAAPRKYETWARNAEVTLVEVDNYDYWFDLAAGYDGNTDGVDARWQEKLDWYTRYQQWYLDRYLGDEKDRLFESSREADDQAEDLWKLLHQYESFGLEVPGDLLEWSKERLSY